MISQTQSLSSKRRDKISKMAMSGIIREQFTLMKKEKSPSILEKMVMATIGRKHGPKRVFRDGLRRLAFAMVNFGKKNGLRRSKNYQTSSMKMVWLFLMSMSRTEVKLKSQLVRNMAKMSKPKKNGLRSGAKSTRTITEKNGATNGKLS